MTSMVWRCGPICNGGYDMIGAERASDVSLSRGIFDDPATASASVRAGRPVVIITHGISVRKHGVTMFDAMSAREMQRESGEGRP